MVAPLLLTPENLSWLQMSHNPDLLSPGLLSPSGMSSRSWDDSYDSNAAFRFTDLADLIESHVTAARVKQPANKSLSRHDFCAYWSSVFADMGQTAALRNHIPGDLFSPPREFIRMRFAAAPGRETQQQQQPQGQHGGGGAPPDSGHFCLDCEGGRGSSSYSTESEDVPDITIEAPRGSGITKELFIRRLAEILYGEPAFGVPPIVGCEMDRPIPLRFGWSRSKFGGGGGRGSPLGGEHLYGPVTIYCEGLGGRAE